SGAFANKKYPAYINQMRLDHFESSEARDAASRIIGAFFGDADSYFRFSPKSEEKFSGEFGLGVFDTELKALHRLARERSPGGYDDRRFSIEMQTMDSIDLRVTHPLAVIVPHIYLADKAFHSLIERDWRCEAISYPIYSLNTSQFYFAIYERVEAF